MKGNYKGYGFEEFKVDVKHRKLGGMNVGSLDWMNLIGQTDE